MKKKLIPALSLLPLTLAIVFMMAPTQETDALAPLAAEWSCNVCGNCNITVTSNNHNSYGFNWGDGTGVTSNNGHHYAFAGSGWQSYNAAVIGYKPNGTSIDNIIGCSIEFEDMCVGGDPTVYEGTCG